MIDYTEVTTSLFENYYDTQIECENISPGCFADIMPQGAKLHMKPTLPSLKYKKGRTHYEFSDLRLLNPIFAVVTSAIIQKLKKGDYDETENPFGFDPDIDLSIDLPGWSAKEIAVIVDVVDAQEIKAKKKGKNGFEIITPFLTHGASTADGIVNFRINKDCIGPVKRWDNASSGIDGLVEMIVNEDVKRFAEFRKEEETE